MKKETKIIRLAMIGFGNAGQAFARLILNKKEDLKKEYGYEILVSAIATGTRGCFYNPQGLDLAKAVEDLASLSENPENLAGKFGLTNSKEIIQKGEYDVLLELTPLNIESGQPAIDHIDAALSRKKHVITANKGPIAIDYRRLAKKAQDSKVKLLFETTVMDGTPVFNLVKETLPFCKVTGFRGILNSTTNFLLEEMAKGVNMEEALEAGRKRGFVEADPSMDTLGWDGAVKTTVLINVLMNGDIKPWQIDREGIENISLKDIEEAQKERKVIKLVCQGKLKDGKILGSVKPEAIAKDDILATVKDTTSILSIDTDLMKTITIIEHEPDIEQTAYGPFSDLLNLFRILP